MPSTRNGCALACWDLSVYDVGLLGPSVSEPGQADVDVRVGVVFHVHRGGEERGVESSRVVSCRVEVHQQSIVCVLRP